MFGTGNDSVMSLKIDSTGASERACFAYISRRLMGNFDVEIEALGYRSSLDTSDTLPEDTLLTSGDRDVSTSAIETSFRKLIGDEVKSRDTPAWRCS